MWTVEKRFGKERRYVTEFVTPNTPDVKDLAYAVGKPNIEETIAAIASWVWANIDYPDGVINGDWHELKAFTTGWFTPMLKFSTGDFWRFPAEVLGQRTKDGRLIGDCEDSSFVCSSLLRNYILPSDILVHLGRYKIYWHAWVEVRHNGVWYILETTKRHPTWALPVPDKHYKSYGYFNDQTAEEIIPGYFSSLAAVGVEEQATTIEKILDIAEFIETIDRNFKLGTI